MQAVDQNVRMMNNAFFSLMDFDGFNPTRALLFGGENKIPIFVRASGGKNIRLARMKDQFRLVKLPSRGKRRGGRRGVFVTRGRAPSSPQRRKSVISSSERRISPWNFSSPGAGSQGGMIRRSVT